MYICSGNQHRVSCRDVELHPNSFCRRSGAHLNGILGYARQQVSFVVTDCGQMANHTRMPSIQIDRSPPFYP